MTRNTPKRSTHPARRLYAVLGGMMLLSGCGLDAKPDYLEDDPGRREGSVYESELKQRGPQSIFGSDSYNFLDIGGGGKKDRGAGGGGIGVNSYLWRASLDTIAFMPLASADPFGGVIITDWYVPPETPRERYKMSVYILGRQLRADGIRVAVFRQQTKGNLGWVNAAVTPATATNLENQILTRARQLRLASAAR